MSDTHFQALNDFMVLCFNNILTAEERALEFLSNGKLSIKEIHMIDAVFRAKERGENNFSTIAGMLGVTLGTLTAMFSRLESKGYLVKERDTNDKRVFFIVPTPLATIINEHHAKWHERLVQGVIKHVPERELDNLIGTLENLAGFIKKSRFLSDDEL